MHIEPTLSFICIEDDLKSGLNLYSYFLLELYFLYKVSAL
jgi:hypothetical protein